METRTTAVQSTKTTRPARRPFQWWRWSYVVALALVLALAFVGPAEATSGSGTDLIEKVTGIINTIKLPLTILAFSFIGIYKIASPIFPELAQQNQQAVRTVIIGAIILSAAAWIAGFILD